MPPKSIERSRTKLLLLLAASVALVLISLWLFVDGLDGGIDDPIVSLGIAPAGIALFGLSGAYVVWKLFDKSPGLTLNERGIVDNSSGIAAGLIPWAEIVDIDAYQINRQKFISVYVADPEKYIRRSGPLKRMLDRANMKMVGTPINISSVGLKISHAELLDTVLDYFSTYRV